MQRALRYTDSGFCLDHALILFNRVKSSSSPVPFGIFKLTRKFPELKLGNLATRPRLESGNGRRIFYAKTGWFHVCVWSPMIVIEYGSVLTLSEMHHSALLARVQSCRAHRRSCSQRPNSDSGACRSIVRPSEHNGSSNFASPFLSRSSPCDRRISRSRTWAMKTVGEVRQV